MDAVNPGVPEQARLNTEARLALAQEFGLLSGREVAARAGSTAVNMSALAARWRRDGRVFAVKHAGAQRYPGFQFSETGQPSAIISPVIEAAGGRLDVIAGPDQVLVVNAMRHLMAELL